MFTEDREWEKLFSEIKEAVQKLDISVPKTFIDLENHENSQYHRLSKVYQLFVESNKNPDEAFFLFKSSLKKSYPDARIQGNDAAVSNLLRLFIEMEEQKQKILKNSILETDMKTKIVEYGLQLPFLDDYSDAFLHNKGANTVEFKFGYGENQELDKVKTIFYENKNYVREFYDKFKDVLQKQSPEFWQYLLYDILKMLCNKAKSQKELQVYLYKELDQNTDAMNYLLTYRMEIVKSLQKQKFLQKQEVGGGAQQQPQLQQQTISQTSNNLEILKALGMSEQEIEKENKLGLKKAEVGDMRKLEKYRLDPTTNKMTKVQAKGGNQGQQKYDQQQEFGDLDFTKMEQSQLRKYVPTLQRTDTSEFLKFRIEPMPKKKIVEEELVQVSTLPGFAQLIFEGVKQLNPIQSRVFPSAFNSDENILLCAPTGAGKTNVALLTIMHEIRKHIDERTQRLKPDDTSFKIVYISPMKALAAEIVEKFSPRLRPMGINVRELTGDMQLSRSEMDDTQIIITTPEKWDVITRKNNSVGNQLNLLIIDEIHLLNDERGPVLECLVARTLQQIERAQRSIRLVGLSATLPNYLDVAIFLHVTKDNVFFFDQTFRPVPLLQNFIGIKEPRQLNGIKKKKQDIYDQVVFDMAQGVLQHGKQVLIFVHSRQETIKACEKFLFQLNERGDFLRKKDTAVSKHHLPKITDKKLKELVPAGLGFHHAGMLRSDRNIVEKLFVEGYIPLLFATATLVNKIFFPLSFPNFFIPFIFHLNLPLGLGS